MTEATAPGKIILFGEHAVVYGHPALAIPVTNVHAVVKVVDSREPGIHIEAPDIGLSSSLSRLTADHPLATAIRLTLDELNISTPVAIKLLIKSNIPVASGLGSGAAVSVALIKALSLHFKHNLSLEKISSLVFEIEKIYHGTPSGIDNTVITYENPIYFISGETPVPFDVGTELTFIIGDTGIPAPTKETVQDVRRQWEKNRYFIDSKFNEIAKISKHAKMAIKSGDKKLLGKLMNSNHVILQELSVSCRELDFFVKTAIQAGAYGAKVSGGGRGGNMIALVEKEKVPVISVALIKAGATHVIISKLSGK